MSQAELAQRMAVTTRLRGVWYNMRRPMTSEKTLKTHRVRYSAAYPTGRERLHANQRGQAPWMPPPGAPSRAP